MTVKKKKEFVTPTGFDITLTHQSKECLIPIVNYLLENGSHQFQWDMEMLTSSGVYHLSIQSSGADNLAEIAKLLGDYGQD
jgi:hypothetical protein